MNFSNHGLFGSVSPCRNPFLLPIRSVLRLQRTYRQTVYHPVEFIHQKQKTQFKNRQHYIEMVTTSPVSAEIIYFVSLKETGQLFWHNTLVEDKVSLETTFGHMGAPNKKVKKVSHRRIKWLIQLLKTNQNTNMEPISLSQGVKINIYR